MDQRYSMDAAGALAEQASHVGPGFSFHFENNRLVVADATERARSQGLENGDVIQCIAIAQGDAFYSLGQVYPEEVVTLLRGSAGSSVGVLLQRGDKINVLWLVRGE